MKKNFVTSLLGRNVQFHSGLANKDLAGKTGVVRSAYTAIEKGDTTVWYQIEVDGHLVKNKLDSNDAFDPKLLPESTK